MDPEDRAEQNRVLRAARLTDVRCLVVARENETVSAYERALTTRGASVVTASTFLAAARAIRGDPLDVLLLQLGGFPEGDGRWIVHEAVFWEPRISICAVSWNWIEMGLKIDLFEHDVLALGGFPELRDAENVIDCVASMVRSRVTKTIDHALRTLSVPERQVWRPVIV